MEKLWIAPENLARDRLAYRAGTANDEKARSSYNIGQFALMMRNISSKELLRAPYEIEYEIHNIPLLQECDHTHAEMKSFALFPNTAGNIHDSVFKPFGYWHWSSRIIFIGSQFMHERPDRAALDFIVVCKL